MSALGLPVADGGDNNSHPRPLKFKPGQREVTITLKTVKGGIKLNEFMLTTDREKTPEGLEKTTSPSVLANDVVKPAPKK